MVNSFSQHHVDFPNYKYSVQSGINSAESSPTAGSFPSLPSKYYASSSIASASDRSHRSGATNPVKSIPKPASKSSFGSVTVKLLPPGFHTFRVTVTADGKPVQRQRLRRRAIEGFVKQTFPEVGDSFAINAQAETNVRTDAETNAQVIDSMHNHIIFPFHNTAQKKWIKSRIGEKSGSVKDVTKQPKRKTGGEGQPIICKISKGALSDQDFNRLKNKNLKARNLEILLSLIHI